MSTQTECKRRLASPAVEQKQKYYMVIIHGKITQSDLQQKSELKSDGFKFVADFFRNLERSAATQNVNECKKCFTSIGVANSGLMFSIPFLFCLI